MCGSKLLLYDCKLMPDGAIESQAPSLCYQQLKAGQSSIFWARDKNCWLQRNETWDCDERPIITLGVCYLNYHIIVEPDFDFEGLCCPVLYPLYPEWKYLISMSLLLLSCDKWSSCNLAVNEMEVINLKMIGIMILRCEWALLQGRARQLINHTVSWIK